MNSILINKLEYKKYNRCPCVKCLVFPACRWKEEYIHCIILWGYLGDRHSLSDRQKKYREDKIESLFKKRIHIYDARMIAYGQIELVLWWETPGS